MPLYNYTNRVKILPGDVTVKLDDEERSFTMSIEFNNHHFPDTARIAVEPYISASEEICDLGTVGKPKKESFPLGDLDPEYVKFRVKIISDDKKDKGKLLGSIRSVSPRKKIIIDDVVKWIEVEEPANRRSLLPIHSTTLSGVVCKVDYKPNWVFLDVDKEAIPQKGVFSTSHEAISLIYPSAIKEVLTKIMIIDGDYEEYLVDDRGEIKDWQTAWLSFFKKMVEDDIPQPDDDQNEKANWIDRAVETWSTEMRAQESFQKVWRKDSEENTDEV